MRCGWDGVGSAKIWISFIYIKINVETVTNSALTLVTPVSGPERGLVQALFSLSRLFVPPYPAYCFPSDTQLAAAPAPCAVPRHLS
jgi:hypothetical protein